jgi:hypothetical protein
MALAPSVVTKRRVLVDALTMCLQRSRVCETVSADTLRSLLNSAIGELWREGEFRLETVWKILCQQPGLGAVEVAPPLLAFKEYEQPLGVRVRLPDALSTLPPPERQRLRESIRVSASDFAPAIAELQKLAADDAKSRDAAALAHREQPTAAPGRASPARRRLALALAGASLLSLSIALVVTFHSTAQPFDVSDVETLVRLDEARRGEQSAVARIVDGRWNSLGRDEQLRIAGRVFDVERKKGIRSLTLTDEHEQIRVMVSDVSGAPQVLLR